MSLLKIFVVSMAFIVAAMLFRTGMAYRIQLEQQREEQRIQRKTEREKEFAEHPGANSRIDRFIRWGAKTLTGGTKP